MAFPASVLLSSFEQCWLTGLPHLLSHDHHRLIGWTRPVSLYLQPGVGLLAGEILDPNSADDENQISEAYYRVLANRVKELVAPHREELTARMPGLLRGDERLAYTECAALQDNDLAVRRFPAVFAQRDKDGLVPLQCLSSIAPGIYDAGDGLVLFAHPFFRRSLSRLNSMNEAFLGRFQNWALNLKGSCDARIALDSDLVGLKNTLKETIELEYWWGPKFSNELAAIDYGVARHEADERTRVFHGISRTEFGWYEQGGNPTFECEEVRDIETLGAGEGKFGCRFVHSIVDARSSQPFHLDGAIRIYNEEKMIVRSETDFKSAGRNTDYTKLWRLDRSIPIAAWKELISHYFRDNRLVGEYFGGAEEMDASLQEVETPQADEIRTLVPCDLQPADGLRLSISIHGKGPEDTEVVMKSFDVLRRGDAKIPYVEADTVEFIKVAKRLGLEIQIPGSLTQMAFKDLVLNLPLVLHRGVNALRNAEITAQAVNILCTSWSKLNCDKLLSFTVGIEFSKYELRISWAGHVQALKEFVEAGNRLLPLSFDDVHAWTDRTLSALSDLFPDSRRKPTIWRLLQRNSGILRLDRRLLQPSEFKVDAAENIVVADELYTAMHEMRVSPTEVWVIERARCSKGHPDYRSCECIKSVDYNVSEIVEKASLVGFCLTNRPA